MCQQLYLIWAVSGIFQRHHTPRPFDLCTEQNKPVTSSSVVVLACTEREVHNGRQSLSALFAPSEAEVEETNTQPTPEWQSFGFQSIHSESRSKNLKHDSLKRRAC